MTAWNSWFRQDIKAIVSQKHIEKYNVSFITSGKTSSGWGTSTVILLGVIAVAVVYYFMGQNKVI